MPCHPIVKNGKVVGWACQRGPVKLPPCYKCGAPSTKLCDHRDMESRYQTDTYGRKLRKIWIPYLNTCDRPMCDACANHVDPDTDYCDEHNNELAIQRSLKAEALFQEQVRQFDMSDDDTL